MHHPLSLRSLSLTILFTVFRLSWWAWKVGGLAKLAKGIALFWPLMNQE
jgi:hypothetical protein